MTQLVINDLDDDVVAALDAYAAQRGLTRAEEAKQLLIAATASQRRSLAAKSRLADHLLALADIGFDFEPERNRVTNPNRLTSFE